MKGFLQNHYAKIFAALLIVALVLILWSYGRIDDRFVLTVDGFNLKKAEGVTVGRNSDINFDKVPSDYMSLDFTEDSMTVTIDSEADTLLYYKVNGENPNLHLLSENTGIAVNYDGTEILISYDDVKKRFDQYSRLGLGERITGGKPTEYIMLKHIIALTGNANDALVAKMMQDKLFRSFVYAEDGEYKVCILDRFTTYEGKEYAFSIRYAPVDGIYQIQFFRMVENVYRKSDPNNTDVVINDIYYAVKPAIITTEWGAGHAAIRPVSAEDKLSVDVSFPKGVTYVENLDSLYVRSACTSYMMTVSQSGNAFPVYNNIYVPAFSESVPVDFASVVFADGRTRLIDPCNDTTVVRKSGLLYPLQQNVEIKSDAEEVHVRTAILNGRYWASYCVFPTVIYLLLMVFSWLVFREKGRIPYVVNHRRVQDYYQYFQVLLTILYAYVLCKIFIAIKLSFTYPYFEKLSGIVVTSTSLMLLLMTTITFLLNFSFLAQQVGSRGGRYSLWKRISGYFEDRPGISAVLILALCYVLCIVSMYLMDNGNSLAMKQSYGHGNITFFSNPLKWSKSSAINDTHRSVCYILFLVEFVLLALVSAKVAFLVLCKNAGDKLCKLYEKFPKLYEKFTKLYEKFTKLYEKCTGLFKSDFIRACVIAVIGLLLTVFIPGNYATVFITIIVVWALSRMVITYDELSARDWQNIKVLLGKVLCIILILFLAIVPDQGYMVAWLGLFFAVYVIALMTSGEKYNNTDSRNRLARALVRCVLTLAAVIILLVFGMRIIVSSFVDPDEVSWGRFSRRMELFSNYRATRESGFRYSEADMEFMQIMCHYMQNGKMTKDPLSNDEHFLHKSISTGQSPVVLNDVSVQAAFFGPLGWPAHLIFFLMLAVLFGTVLLFCFAREYRDDGSASFKMTRNRLVALFIWVGASTYLYNSYLGMFPYTGRLIYGFGVDSVGEALEICVLFAFMGQIAISCKEDVKIK